VQAKRCVYRGGQGMIKRIMPDRKTLWMIEAMTQFAPVLLWPLRALPCCMRLHAGLSRSLGFALIATLADLITPHLFEWHWGFLIASENRLAQLA